MKKQPDTRSLYAISTKESRKAGKLGKSKKKKQAKKKRGK
jgi:hypothetical protein